MKNIFIACLVVCVQTIVSAQVKQDSFIRGADVSFTPQIESLGGKYTIGGVEKDALDLLKENGVNYIRLRLWHTPTGGWCGLSQTSAYARRVKAKGLKFLLDIHYSDWWADPAKQNKPAAWATASYSALKESVYTYTKVVIKTLKKNDALPDMVQIGNEITPGMLWPDGQNNTSQGWVQFGELLKEGIRGAQNGAADSTVKIMIHIDCGGDNATARWFYDNLIAQGVRFDVIGLSYYPWWHGAISAMKTNINDLAVRYNKDIVIAETAYPWTTQSLNDGMGNVGVDATKLPKGYPISVQGQKAFVDQVTRTIHEAPGGRGIGYFYWEPAYISVAPIGSSWEHLTVFDFAGSALSSIGAFANLDTIKTINVKVRLNTSTLWDTLSPSGVAKLQGEILGVGSSFLPSGELLTWDSYTGVVPKNIGGDYWETQFSMYAGDRLEYKFWTGHTASVGTNLRLGNEGPVAPSDGTARNNRLIVAGARDTTLEVQYFNSSGYSVGQFWTPMQKKQDSIAVYFRVNLSALMAKKQFDPEFNGPIAVRGDSASSGGVLSWFSNRVILQRESLSVAGGSFYSGTAYFPKNSIAVGRTIPYKFYAANTAFGGWESGIANRILKFPSVDSTLAWKNFNDNNAVTKVQVGLPSLPERFQLLQNYPNPFNPSTTIRYSVPHSSNVVVTVFNLLGQRVCTLTNRLHAAGTYTFLWNGTDDAGNLLTAGVYFVRLTTGVFTQVRTMIMIK